MSRSSHRGLLLLTGATLLFCGCASKPTESPPDERHLKALAVLAGKLRATNRGQMPPTFDAFKAALKKMDSGTLKGVGADPADFDGLFTSTRDKKPFVYRPSKGAGGPTMTPDGKKIFVPLFYEAEGSGGSRWVVDEVGDTELISAARFKELVPEAP